MLKASASRYDQGMVAGIAKENFFWHKLHSLTGVVPVGFYVLQHLILNSFSLVSPERYNGVSGFFYSLPPALLWTIELGVVLIPLTFHAVYGIFITRRAQPNAIGTPYNWSQNRMYFLQRISGIWLFIFILFHVITTTGKVKYFNDHTVVDYAQMQAQFSWGGGVILIAYALGIIAAAYHLSYGIWNFCIRWGITVSETSQRTVQKISLLLFLAVTAIGIAALIGFKKFDVSTQSMQVQNGPSHVAKL